MANRLLTIPISHFCEKARWALKVAQIPFVEERHLQGFHVFATRRYRAQTLPILITANKILKDSTEILLWADENSNGASALYPKSLYREVQEFENELDEGLGPAGRLWLYTYAFDFLPLLQKYSGKHKVPRYQVWLLPHVLRFFKPQLMKRLRWSDDSRERTQAQVDETFDRVGAMLGDGRSYLFGDKFSAADLTFAALAAPVIIPEKYGVELPRLDELPVEMRDQIEKWRAHPAGRHALRIYENHR